VSRQTERLGRAADEAGRQGFDALVVAPSADLAYLTGYDPMPLERPTLLVLRPGTAPVMLVPELERPLALGSPVGGDVEMIGWRDGMDPYEAAAELLPAGGRIGVGDRLWSSHLLGLQSAVPGGSFAPGSIVVAALRAVKDEDEIGALRRAGRAADETFREICGATFLGRREEEIAAELAALLVRNGHARADFTIVASGANSASPHHEPSGRTMLPRDAVVLDFGGELAGYYSDTTRTVVVGEPPDGFEAVYDVVHDAQEAAFRAVRPGVTAESVDRAARAMIEDAGYGERFIHRTGHGIGLEVHEPPYLVEGSGWELRPGTTFSIEPGVYLEGAFGVRIEDIVVVTEDGADRLNRSTRDLQTVG
jgi:D-alanyl-D-alanine dipeptidase